MAKNKDNWSYKHDYPIEEIWSTYHTLAREIVPRLQAFKALDKHGYAPGMRDMKQWNSTAQKMIDAFELMKYDSSFTAEKNKTIADELDREMTKDMHIIHPVHNLISHTDFSIFDIFWVRDFNVEVCIESDYANYTEEDG